MGHGGDVIAELTADHREVDELFAQFTDAMPGSADRKRLVDAITIELVRHSVAEEQHLYPAVREHLEEGAALADKELAHHARVEELLKELEEREPADIDFDRLVVKLRTEVTAHVDDEENHLFAQLRNHVHPYILESLGKRSAQRRRLPPPARTRLPRARRPPTSSSPPVWGWSTGRGTTSPAAANKPRHYPAGKHMWHQRKLMAF